MKNSRLTATALAVSMTILVGSAIAHDGGDNDAGTPVCLEANYMVADAQNLPFASAAGLGRVIEQNIITGERGITVNNPFSGANAGTPVCPDEVVCGGPWKPTGTFSGGQKGHAYITSAAQHALTELHRDGTAIRTLSYNDVLEVTSGDGGGFGHVPRPLGTQIMPNGNLVQAICDANFFNAGNSDQNPDGSNRSNNFFPPVYSTPERAANSRILVIDQDTLEVIDEYNQPANGEPGHDLWGCAAGIAFTDEGMFISTFHGGAVLVIDWRDGVDDNSRGVGSNIVGNFSIGKLSNQAKVIRVIDYVGGDADNPNRRDTLRAVTLDEQGNVYTTNRRRSQACEEGEAGCNPGVFRQRVSIDIVAETGGANDEDATLALDPGVNVIAGIRINRMSARGCDFVQAEAINNGADPESREVEELCNVETLYVAASAMNPGEILNQGGCEGGHPANACFKPGGYVAEYRIDEAHLDGGSAWGGGQCNGNPTKPAQNKACAQPIATFGGAGNGDDNLDPRMLMPIQRAFIQ
jgi:hypothetical protein